MEDLNRALFVWLAAGNSPQPFLLIVARVIAEYSVFFVPLALLAIWFARRPATPEKSFGYYRIEIFAAVANAMILFAVAGYILYEAIQRFSAPPAGPSKARVSCLPYFRFSTRQPTVLKNCVIFWNRLSLTVPSRLCRL